jgi:hypothetical protein
MKKAGSLRLEPEPELEPKAVKKPVKKSVKPSNKMLSNKKPSMAKLSPPT